jgi:prepilin-type processing-associated H-X9-DG protein
LDGLDGGDVVNVLFLDGHVEMIDVTLPDGVKDFNTFWYGGIPQKDSLNPWFDAI